MTTEAPRIATYFFPPGTREKRVRLFQEYTQTDPAVKETLWVSEDAGVYVTVVFNEGCKRLSGAGVDGFFFTYKVKPKEEPTVWGRLLSWADDPDI